MIERLWHMLRPHSHELPDKVDAAMEASAEGIRALWISLAILGATVAGPGGRRGRLGFGRAAR